MFELLANSQGLGDGMVCRRRLVLFLHMKDQPSWCKINRVAWSAFARLARLQEQGSRSLKVGCISSIHPPLSWLGRILQIRVGSIQDYGFHPSYVALVQWNGMKSQSSCWVSFKAFKSPPATVKEPISSDQALTYKLFLCGLGGKCLKAKIIVVIRVKNKSLGENAQGAKLLPTKQKWRFSERK